MRSGDPPHRSNAGRAVTIKALTAPVGSSSIEAMNGNTSTDTTPDTTRMLASIAALPASILRHRSWI